MEASTDRPQIDAIIRHSWPPTVVRGVCVDFDTGEMSTWGIQWMVSSLPAPLSSGAHFRIRCNAYNVATAGSCFLGIAFGISVFFDIKDLHQSQISPRSRT